jgi:hypothetical protein
MRSQQLTSAGDHDLFIAKLSPDGNPLWVTSLGGPDHDAQMGVAADSSGSCYVTGYLDKAGQLGSLQLPAGGLVVKLSASGQPSWATSVGAARAYKAALDAAGYAYVTGSFDYATKAIGSVAVTNRGFRDVFVARLSPSGQIVDVVTGGGADEDVGIDLAIDAKNNLYVVGFFSTQATFGASTLNAQGEPDVFVWKLRLP